MANQLRGAAPGGLDPLFRALSDPTRRAVVERLTRGPATVTELAEPFDMALPSFLQHLRLLEECGLLQSKKAGRVRTCALNPASFAEAEDWMKTQREIWERRLDQLDDYVLALYRKQTEKDNQS